MTTDERPAAPERSTVIWRWRWVLVAPTAICLAACLAIAFSTPVARLVAPRQREPDALEADLPTPGDFDRVYESRATLELQDNRPIGEQPPQAFNMALAIMDVKTRALSWNSIREIVLSRKVDFGREIDPDDRRQLEQIHEDVTRRTRVEPLGERHIVVSHRSPSPERNASLVNELVKKFVAEDTREAQDRAKTDLKFYRDRLASAKTQLSEVDGQIREFTQQYPWLTETLAEIHQKFKEAEDAEAATKRQALELETAIQDIRKDLAKEPAETVTLRPGGPAAEALAALTEVELGLVYLDAIYRRTKVARPNWQEARRALDTAIAKLKDVDVGEEETVEERQPNPKHEAIIQQLTAKERELKLLEMRRVEASKKVSEWYVNQRKAPELLAERRALEEQRQEFAAVAKEDESRVRGAEKELNRLLTVAYQSRFRVIEYARDDRTPVEEEATPDRKRAESKAAPGTETPKNAKPSSPEVAQPSVGDVQAFALACAVGMVIALSPFLTMIVLSRLARRRQAGDQAAPRRASTLALFAVGSACVLLPFAALVAAVALHLSHTPPAPLREEAAKHGQAKSKQAARPGAPGAEEAKPKEQERPKLEQRILGPVSVESVWKGDIKFPRLDGAGMVTTEVHFFREMLPEKAKVFTVSRDSEVRDTIVAYRLKQVATGEVYSFEDVEVRKIAGEWTITEQGWRKIRGELQAKLRLSLGGPIN